MSEPRHFFFYSVSFYLCQPMCAYPTIRVRRLGLGRLLLSSIERHALQMGAREIYLHVEIDNDAARQLYRSVGYTEVPITWPVTVFTQSRLQKPCHLFVLCKKTLSFSSLTAPSSDSVHHPSEGKDNQINTYCPPQSRPAAACTHPGKHIVDTIQLNSSSSSYDYYQI
jgi:hypothetical protein